MKSFLNISRDVWHFAVPTLIMFLLFVYIVFGNSIQTADNESEITDLLIQKEVLMNELGYLKSDKENAICLDGDLVVPKDNLKSLAPPKTSTTFLEKLEESVVLILVPSEKGLAFGSGFFISPNRIVTNGHVVKGERVYLEKVFILNKSIPIQEVNVERIFFEGNFSKDFAILKTSERIGRPLKIARIKDPKTYKLAKIYAAGFPGAVIESDEAFIKLLENDKKSVPDLVVTDGTISSHQNVFGEVSAFIHTAQISQGNSGGPLVNECGEVMAVNTFILSNESGIRNFSQTADELISFLNESDIPVRLSVKECR